MKNIIVVTSDLSVGATFVDWSLHFLSGQNNFYNFKQSNVIPLSHNPVTELNAHGHLKNHPSGFLRTRQQIEKFLSVPGDFFTVYPCKLHADLISNTISTLSADEWQELVTKQYADTNLIFKYCYDNLIKLIYINLDPSVNLYSINCRSLDRMPFENRKATSAAEMKDSVDRTFFSDNISKWSELGLTNIWDIRERLALCSRPLEATNLRNDSFDFSGNHLWIDSRALWYDGKNTIKKILDYANLTLDVSRWEQWCTVYNSWQEKQLKAVQFAHEYQHIVDAVVNNWHYKIDLTFDQEVVIQHCLIYQFGLNLKTWQLDKFPTNTKELHLLLEPNIHPL